MGDDKGKSNAMGTSWVRKAEQKQPPFDPLKERETFFEARREFADLSNMDQGKSYSHVDGNLRNFLESCIKLIRDQIALAELQSILRCCEK